MPEGDLKGSQLNPKIVPLVTDLVIIVSDPAGTPETMISTIEQIFAVDPHRPSSDEKAAFGGSAGTPSVANPFVTDEDDRLSKAWADITGKPTSLDGYGINGHQVLEVGNNPAYAGLTLRSIGGSVGTAFRFMYNATDYGGLYLSFGTPESLLLNTKTGAAIQLAVNGIVHHELTPSGVTALRRNQGTVLGTSQMLELRDNIGNNSGRVEIAMGYRGGTYFPSLIGSLVTSDAGQEANALYFATRALTTDSPAIERMRVHASGGVSIGTSIDPGDKNLQVAGTLKNGGYTVATLPAGVVGASAYVTDALAPAYLAPLVGGGAEVCPAFFNGLDWVAH